jgi:signal transduction histidine kinase/CheY-like chemotaxis protein
LDTKGDINWTKEALAFISRFSLADHYQDWFAIMQFFMSDLKERSGADQILLLKSEDELTASLFELNDAKTSPKYIDPAILTAFGEASGVSHLEAPFAHLPVSFLPFLKGNHLVVLPIDELDQKGYLVLCWHQAPDNYADFETFLAVCLTKINETIKLSRTYYSLEELKVRFNAILQTVPQSIIFIDDSGQNSWVNDPAAELLGIAGGNVSPAALSMAMNQFRAKADNKAEILEVGMKIFKSADKQIKDWKWIFSDPAFFVLNVCCAPTISKHVSGMLWTFDDITQQYLYDENLKELNAQLEEKSRLADEQNRAKSEFLANMSHEIRTPMNGVMGMTSLLRHTELSEEQFDFVESIRISADALLEIINEILDFSKIESGKLELEEHPFFLHKIIEETYDLLSFKAQEKDLDLLYVIDPDVPTEVIGDMTRLRQIVVNLVGNAIKFTDSGEVLTSIKLSSKHKDIYELEFAVQDSGIGIPADKMHKLFNSFSQVDSSTTRKYGGTGLGLAISARLIDKMNGRIWVESTVDVGTTFRFTINLKANKQVKEYKSVTLQQDLLGRNILIIDDNHTNLRILKGHCEHWGMHADTFDNGEAGIASAEKKKYDIAVIDLLMPEMNGIDVAKQLRSRVGHQLPLVLFSSAGSFPSDQKENMGLFAAILDKPIKQSYFYKMLLDKLAQAKEVKKPEPVEKPDVAVNVEDTLQILVAEDNLINQKIISNAFKNIGYPCDVVSNGLEVLSSLKRQHYDIVMMDVQMPEMDGLQATRTLVKEFGTARPVVIAMTAGAYEQDREACIQAGMDDYLTKPFDFNDLYYKINFWKGKIKAKK